MKSVRLVCVSLVFGLVAAPAQPQVTKTPATQVRPSTAGTQPIARSVFLANMDTEFRKMDADKNGTLTRTEIEDFERAVSVVKAQAKNRQLFARLDIDRNGQLSAAEFARLATPAPVSAEPIVARMDMNHDQAVTLIEYRTATLSNFDRMDSDKNGIVSPAEMKAAGVGR